MKISLLVLIAWLALLSACGHSAVNSGWLGPGPTDVAVAANGDVYITHTGFSEHPGRLVKLVGGKGPPVVVPTGLSYPEGVAVAANGDLYVSDANANRLVRLVGGVGPAVDLITGLHYPRSVAVGGNGDVFFTGDGTLWKLSGGAGSPVEVVTGLDSPTGVAVSGAGTVYVAGYVYGTEISGPYVAKLASGVGPPVLLPAGLTQPGGIAVGPTGEVYVADSNTEYMTGRVVRLNGSNGVATDVAIRLDLPRSVAVAGNGDVYIVDRTGLLKLDGFHAVARLRTVPAQDREPEQSRTVESDRVPEASLNGVGAGR